MPQAGAKRARHHHRRPAAPRRNAWTRAPRSVSPRSPRHLRC